MHSPSRSLFHAIFCFRWPKFIQFLRKAIGSSPRRERKPPVVHEAPPQQLVPDRPAWETRAPLSSIGHHDNNGFSDQATTHNAWDINGETAPTQSNRWGNLDPFQQPQTTDDPGYHSNPSDSSPQNNFGNYFYFGTSNRQYS